MRNFSFTPTSFTQYNEWADTDRKIRNKIIELLKDIQRNPFNGIGKPEPLKYQSNNCWSRRINHEHRLIYQVTPDGIIIISCKYHY